MNTIAVKFLAAGLLLASAGSALAEVHYVDVNSTNATPPFTNWPTAATNIQDAVDAAVAGDEIVVTNGTYATGGRAVNGTMTNRVAVDKPLSVRSVNGQQFTTIDGGGQVRCAYLTNGANLSGFSLTNGFNFNQGGGGVYGGTLNNCTLTGNAVSATNFSELPGGASAFGGGAYGCTLNNCTLAGNSAYSSYSYSQTGSNIMLGGGAAFCTLNNCTLSGNSVSVTNNSVLGPSIYAYGGGASDCTLNNCTLIGNSASAWSVGGAGAHAAWDGAFRSTLNNCIVYFNTAQQGTNYDSSSILNYCCTTPQPTNGVGNITNAPLFVDTNRWSNLRLQPNSPCINAGNNSYATNATDLDGNPRISGGVADMGAYEFQWPQLTITLSGSTRILTWNAEPGRTYRLQYKRDWNAVNWIVLGGDVIATGPTVTFADPSLFDPWRVYRVVSMP